MRHALVALLIFISTTSAFAVPAYPKLGGRTVNEKGQYGIIFKMIDSRVWVRYTNSDGEGLWPIEIPYDKIFLIEGTSMWGFEHGDDVAIQSENGSHERYGRVVGITVRSVLLIRIRNSSELVTADARLVRSASCNADLGGD